MRKENCDICRIHNYAMHKYLMIYPPFLADGKHVDVLHTARTNLCVLFNEVPFFLTFHGYTARRLCAINSFPCPTNNNFLK